jgi:geranylgeranyl diphosphate synthase type I
MDGSDTRRGKPAIHKQFGDAAAILIGDLALVWNEQTLHKSGLGSPAVNSIHDIMRTELMAGQFLDVYEQTQKSYSVERSLKIARYKSGKYSIERPLHYGAALANPSNLESFYNIFSEYGLPLGEAFQLRDDLLGVFGDSAETGKPSGDDLREGKRTALVAYAYDRGNDAIKKLIETKLGTNDVSDLADAILQSGAVTHVEDLIEKLAEEALDAIERDEINNDAKTLLIEMVSLVTKRSR